jgi:hypothetical protein
MNNQDTDILLLEIKRRVDDLDRMARTFGHLDSVFPGMDFPLPKTKPAELGFIRTVGWLYALYHETGKASVQYLAEIMINLKCGNYSDVKKHIDIIPTLRTALQHNLDPRSKTDKRIVEEKAVWFQSKCGTAFPSTDEHWHTALSALLSDTLSFFDGAIEVIRVIEVDDSSESMLQDWKVRVQRFHPPHLFDEIISMAAVDVGLSSIDCVEFRKKNFSEWQKQLKMLKWPYDFKVEARKLIEQSLLKDDVRVLPITGKDIMENFNLQPGPTVGKLLCKANEIHKERGLNKDALLKAINDFVSGQAI